MCTVEKLVNSTVEDVSIKEDVGYESIMGIIDRYIRGVSLKLCS